MRLDLVVSLFADEKCVDIIEDTDMREWIRACVQEPAQLFMPLAREVASRWLTGLWAPTFCMSVVWEVLIVLNGENPREIATGPVSADTVITVARWAQLEENAHWHHRVAGCLGELGHVDAAIEHLNAALALEATWGVKKNLAMAYGIQGRLEDALQLLRECEVHYTQQLLQASDDDKMSGLKNNEARPLFSIRYYLGLLHVNLGDYPNALHWFMQCVEVRDSIRLCEAVTGAIRVLIASQWLQYESIIELAKKIDREPGACGENGLIKVFEDNFGHWHHCHRWDTCQLPLIFAVSAKRCNELQWLEGKYQSALTERNMQDIEVICLKESLAHLYDKFLGDEDKAIRIWTSIIAQHRVPESFQYGIFCRARNRAVAAYARRLLANALREVGDSQALIVQELEKLCDREIESWSTDNILADGQPAIYMGAWHRLHGREQEARNYFKPYVIQALAGCNDPRDEYATNAQRILGHLFAMTGDDEYAITLLQLIHSPLGIRAGTSPRAEERMASPWPFVGEDHVWYCHICLRSWGNFVSCNICRLCSADICEGCLEGLQAGDAEGHACDSSHEWLFIPPPPGVPGTYQLRRDGQVLSVEGYLTAIERSWM